MGPPVTWVETDPALRQVIDSVGAGVVYAFDTEFHRERTYFPQLALVQLAWEGGIALVDPQRVDLRPLAAALRGSGLAVAHAPEQDLEVLDRACGAVPSRLFDTQLAAGFLGLASASLATLVHRVLGLRVVKADRLTDWTRRPLSEAQRRYAAFDVAHLLDLRAELVRRLEASGRLAWAEEECRQLLARSRQPQEPETAWWRLKDSRSLRGRSRGVAQAVAAWRERTAAAQDRPPRWVLPDLALAGIAHGPPDSEAALRGVRGLEPRHLRGGAADEILEAVRVGLALAPEELRLPPGEELDRHLRPAVTLVSAWVAQLARDLRLDPALLATRSDLHAFLRGEPGSRLSQGWRGDLVGEPIRRLVEGEAALAFRPGSGDLVLEARSGRPFVVEAPVPDEDLGGGGGGPDALAPGPAPLSEG